MDNITVISDYGSIDKSVIEEFENSRSITFPTKYKELVGKHNGLNFIESWFDYFDGTKIDEASFSFLTFGDFIGASIISKLQDLYDASKGIVNFGAVGNGDYIGFDYSQNPETDNPPIVIVYHDDYVEDENRNLKMRIIKVAENFDDFMNMLHE
ncbi:SMI1/KNR4 family protein [Acinetobacter sp. GXMZU3951]|jgi:hypothetical protein